MSQDTIDSLVFATRVCAIIFSLGSMVFLVYSLVKLRHLDRRWRQLQAQSFNSIQKMGAIHAQVCQLDECDAIISPWLKEMRDHPNVGDDLRQDIDRWFEMRRRIVGR